MRDLIPICEFLKELMTHVFDKVPNSTYHSHSKAFVDAKEGTTQFAIPQSTLFLDNNVCLKFAGMPNLTPCTKHIGTPYHLFL